MQQEIWFHKYRILGLLGRGGTSKVYLAEHIKLNSYRAIKFISKNHPLYDLQRKEALLLKNLKHSCIPIIYDIEEDEDGSYIVEQYLEGDTLKDFISSKGAFREDIIIQFGLQICDLIHYLHSIERPVLYVDLKPENIILSGKMLKLIDFGSAIYQDELSDGQYYLGTRGYAAPELYSSNKIDERCDIYGIGMLLYYMSTGLIFQNDDFGIDNIDQIGVCSIGLKHIINHCLKYNPSQRYATVEDISKQLSALQRKNKYILESSQTLIIAVAGAQPRIGVTHLAFRICNYFIRQKFMCLYQEKNKSECIRAIKSCYEDVPIKDGIYFIQGLPMLANKQRDHMIPNNYQVIVQDFGCLTDDNLAEYLKAEIKLLILGAKDWELRYAEQTLAMLTEYKDISFLFNFMNGRQFQQVMRSMVNRNCYRVPYEPNPFEKISQANGLDFFREIIRPIKKTSKKERNIKLFKRGKL